MVLDRNFHAMAKLSELSKTGKMAHKETLVQPAPPKLSRTVPDLNFLVMAKLSGLSKTELLRVLLVHSMTMEKVQS